MKIFFTIILIAITSVGYSQKDKDKPDKKEIKKIQKEQKEILGSNNNLDMVKIDPELVDRFIESIKQGDTNKIWEMIDADVQKVQSKVDIIKLFGLYNTYYGKIVDYSQTTFGMRTNAEYGQLTTVSYDVDFEKYKGKANGVFKVYDKNTVKMLSFNLFLDDYTTIDTIDKIINPILEAIKAKDKRQIYNLTSDKYKEYTSISDFESRINKILDLGIVKFKVFRFQFGVKDGNEILVIFYEINEKADYLKLSFTKLKDKFELDGLNYIPSE